MYMKRVLTFLFLAISATLVLLACKKEYSTEPGNSILATGTLYDSTGNCLPDSVYGTFYNGVLAGSDTAYVQVQVNVTAPGSYSIHSDLQNGFEFADSGYFNTTGINIIKLKPIGAAILPTPTDFTFSFDSTACMFTVNVKDSTGTGLGGTTASGASSTTGNWQFTADSATFQGTFDTLVRKDTLGYSYYFFVGKTATDSAFGLFITFPAGTLTPGVHSTTDPLPAFNGMELDSPAPSAPVYSGSTNNPPGSNITITVTSYDSVSHTLSGTFSGMAANASGAVVINITNGTFTATIP